MRNGDGEIAAGEMEREKQSTGRDGEVQKCKQKKTQPAWMKRRVGGTGRRSRGRRVVLRRGRAGQNLVTMGWLGPEAQAGSLHPGEDPLVSRPLGPPQLIHALASH